MLLHRKLFRRWIMKLSQGKHWKKKNLLNHLKYFHRRSMKRFCYTSNPFTGEETLLNISDIFTGATHSRSAHSALVRFSSRHLPYSATSLPPALKTVTSLREGGGVVEVAKEQRNRRKKCKCFLWIQALRVAPRTSCYLYCPDRCAGWINSHGSRVGKTREGEENTKETHHERIRLSWIMLLRSIKDLIIMTTTTTMMI